MPDPLLKILFYKFSIYRLNEAPVPEAVNMAVDPVAHGKGEGGRGILTLFIEFHDEFNHFR